MSRSPASSDLLGEALIAMTPEDQEHYLHQRECTVPLSYPDGTKVYGHDGQPAVLHLMVLVKWDGVLTPYPLNLYMI